MFTTEEQRQKMQRDLVERMRASAEEVAEFPHPSHCEHLHDASAVMREGAAELAALRARVAEFAQIAHDEAVAAQKLADRVAEAEALLGALRKPPCVDDPVEWVGVPNDWWGRYEAWTGPSAGGGHE